MGSALNRRNPPVRDLGIDRIAGIAQEFRLDPHNAGGLQTSRSPWESHMFLERMVKAIWLAVGIASPVAAQTPLYEKILLPVVANEPLAGAFGSSWTTDIWILNGGPQPLAVGGIAWTCFLPECIGPTALHPGVTFRPIILDGSEGLQGTFVHPVAGFADWLSFGLRFRDTSRQSQTWGTELPAVRERSFRSGRVSLIDIPLTEGFRQVLRIYELDGREREALVRVRMYRIRLENWEPYGTPD